MPTTSIPDSPDAVITAANSPVGTGGYVEYIQATSGTMTIDLSNVVTPGLITLTLQANNTGVTFSGSPAGTYGVTTREFVFSVRQYAGAPFTWVPPTNVSWSGGTPGATATTDFARDNYRILWTGKNYMEVGRALNVLA
jgi:hypothetical protein